MTARAVRIEIGAGRIYSEADQLDRLARQDARAPRIGGHLHASGRPGGIPFADLLQRRIPRPRFRHWVFCHCGLLQVNSERSSCSMIRYGEPAKPRGPFGRGVRRHHRLVRRRSRSSTVRQPPPRPGASSHSHIGIPSIIITTASLRMPTGGYRMRVGFEDPAGAAFGIRPSLSYTRKPF
jgi:hypothetical protein